MTLKISEKDKSLLIVLAIIIVLFAGIMMPKFGIKALLEETQTVKIETEELVASNALKLGEIMQSGIPERYAENYQRAQDAMENNILHKKHEAIKIANIICNYSSTSVGVPYDWVEDIHYLNYQINELNVYASVFYEEQSANLKDIIVFPSGDEEIEDEEVGVMISSIRIKLLSEGFNEFGIQIEMQDDEFDLSSFARLLVYLAQLEQKGSIIIDSYTYNYDPDNHPDGDSTVSFTIFMPPEGDMKNYSAFIGECGNCGEPYYYEDAANGDYVCACGAAILPQ